MSTLVEYKCLNCAGAIKFDSQLQKMQCPYCDSEFEIEALKSYEEAVKADSKENLDWAAYEENSGNGDWQEGEKEGLYNYSCDSCGGQIVGEEHTGATACPYCDNPVVIASQFSGMFRPDFVVPFKLDKEQAKTKLKEFYKNKFLLPSTFTSENKIDSIMGLYVPFWLFSCDSASHIRYKARKIRMYSDNNYNYVETRHFLVTRGGEIKFANIPVDGSSKIDDTAMESIEPFIYSDLKDFQTAYLAGYLADKYDVEAEAVISRVNKRIENTVLDIFAPKEYTSYSTENVSIQLAQDKVHYALLPIWILTTKYRGTLHTFFINGQTGKFSGKLPISKGKALLYFSGIFASIAAIAATVIYFVL